MGCYAHANAFVENDSYKKSKGPHSFLSASLSFYQLWNIWEKWNFAVSVLF